MEAREIIEFIGNAEKKTPVKVYVKEKALLILRDVRYSEAATRSCSETGRM